MKALKIFFSKYFICPWAGHILQNIQYRNFKDYFIRECIRCKYTDGIEHTSPIIIEDNEAGTSIKVEGAGGGGAWVSMHVEGGQGGVVDMMNERKLNGRCGGFWRSTHH